MEDTFFIQTKVQPSTIENGGNARYFMEDVEKGVVVRKQKIGSKTLQAFKNEKDLEGKSINIFQHYGHSVPKNCEYYCDTIFLNDPFLFTNHSDNPNIKFEYTKDYKYTITTRSVKSGEEMFQNYCDFKKVDWFEQYLAKNNLIGARQFGKSVSNEK